MIEITALGPWKAKKTPGETIYYACVVIDGKDEYADCAIRCTVCGDCLGCVRKMIFQPDTGTFKFTSLDGWCNNEEGVHHKPGFDQDETACPNLGLV